MSRTASRARSDDGTVRPLGWRVAFATVLALAMGSGTLLGYAFGVLGPALVTEFSLSRTQLGLLTSVFFLVGGCSSLAAGPAVDRLGARRVMLAAFALMGVSLAAMAASPDYVSLLGISAVAGLALSTGNPTTNKAVAEQIPPGRRGITMGVKQAGVQVVAFLAGAVLAPVAAHWGWRPALLLGALVPAAGLVGTLVTVPRDPPKPDPGTGAVGSGPLSAVRRMAVYAFLMGAAVAAVNAYLPLYAVERLGMSVPAAGAVVAAMGMVGILSRVAWGWGSERMRSFALPLVGMGAGAVVAVGAVAVAPSSAWLVWPGALLFGATAVAWNSVGMLAVLATVDPAEAGRASGIVLFGFYSGFVPGPLLFGATVDAVGYGAAWALVLAVLGAAAVLMLPTRRTARRP